MFCLAHQIFALWVEPLPGLPGPLAEGQRPPRLLLCRRGLQSGQGTEEPWGAPAQARAGSARPLRQVRGQAAHLQPGGHVPGILPFLILFLILLRPLPAPAAAPSGEPCGPRGERYAQQGEDAEQTDVHAGAGAPSSR